MTANLSTPSRIVEQRKSFLLWAPGTDDTAQLGTQYVPALKHTEDLLTPLTTIWLHWSMRVEGSPFHRKAWGTLWASTDQAGGNRISVDHLSVTVEMPNLTGGTERNTDAKPSSQVDCFVEAYGTSFTVPSFTANYRFAMRHKGYNDWAGQDSQSL